MEEHFKAFEENFEDVSERVERIEEGNKVDKEEIIDELTLFVKGQIESIQRVISKQKYELRKQKVEEFEDEEDKTMEIILVGNYK